MEEQILRFSEMRYIPILEHGNDVPLELEFVIRGEVVLGANALADAFPRWSMGTIFNTTGETLRDPFLP